MNNDNSGNTEKSKKKKKILVFILLLLVLLGIFIVVMHQFGYFHYPWEKPVTTMVSKGKKGTLSGLSEEEVMAMLQDNADKDKVRIQINTELTQQEDGSFDFMIQNLETNLYDEVVKIYLGNDSYGDLLYESGRIAPGYVVEYDQLQINEPLEPGKHDAIAYITFFDGDTALSTTTIDLKIIVNE